MSAILWLLTFLFLLMGWLLSGSLPLGWGAGTMAAASVISWFLLIPLRSRQKIILEAPSVAAKGSQVCLKISLPPCQLPLGRAILWLEAENAVTGQHICRRLSVSGEGSCMLQSPFCGSLQCRITRVWALDLFGLLPMPLPCRAKKRITFMTDTFPVELPWQIHKNDSPESEEYSQEHRGSDLSETFQIREYVPGDSLHQIHWKLTGKTGKPMIREGSCPIDYRLTVLVERQWEHVEPHCADALMEAAVSLCQALTDQGLPFLLAWNETSLRQYPISDAEQLPEAVSALLKSRPISEGQSGAAMMQNSSSGTVLYFCNQLPQDAAVDFSRFCTFCCGSYPQQTPVISFTPENMPDVFRHLEGQVMCL